MQHGAVERVGDELVYAGPDQQLIWFAMQLFKRLPTLGTVLAFDLSAYGRHMEDIPASLLEQLPFDASPAAAG